MAERIDGEATDSQGLDGTRVTDVLDEVWIAFYAAGAPQRSADSLREVSRLRSIGVRCFAATGTMFVATLFGQTLVGAFVDVASQLSRGVG